MANTFTRKFTANVGNTAANIGGFTATTTTVVVGLTVSNRTGGTINVDVSLLNSGNTYYLVKSAPIASGGALVPIGGDQKLVLINGDAVQVKSDAANSADAIMSIMEIT